MKKSMEADIRAQLEANMAMMNNNASTWEERVGGDEPYHIAVALWEKNWSTELNGNSRLS